MFIKVGGKLWNYDFFYLRGQMKNKKYIANQPSASIGAIVFVTLC